MIGGVTVDADGRSTLPGLWAAGEATSSGLHGANRLGSNSLLEGLVFGLRAGRGASQAAAERPDTFAAIPLVSDWTGHAGETDDQLNLTDQRNSLMSLMWRNVGIQRDAGGLKEAAEQVEFWDRYVAQRELNRPEGWELQNMLLVARLMIASAAARRESRGVHNRADFPATDPSQAEHIAIVGAAS
jgi:L-aspartate oxidase